MAKTVRGNLSHEQIQAAARSGEGILQTVTGTTPAGKVPMWDDNGDFVSSGKDASGIGAGSSGGVFTTQTNATASRARGTVYRNTGVTPIMVNVDTWPDSTGSRWLRAYTGAANPPTTEVSQFYVTNGAAVTVTFIVPPGYYYGVEWRNVVTAGWAGSALGTVGAWIEWS